jgi:hypothetical protein
VTPGRGTGPLAPGTVLQRALLCWGLGHLALGRIRAGGLWFAAELGGLALVAYLAIGLADTTAYLVPYVAGSVFVAAWAAQATIAYREARAREEAAGPVPGGSPAAAMIWLSLPLLIWGSGFWLVGAQGTTPSAVLDRFEASWPDLGEKGPLPASITTDPAAVTAVATSALAGLLANCPASVPDCSSNPAALLRTMRITITDQGPDAATGVVQLVTFERQPSRFLWIISGTELVPVPTQTVLVVELRAAAAPLPGGLDVGARRWKIVSARAP